LTRKGFISILKMRFFGISKPSDNRAVQAKNFGTLFSVCKKIAILIDIGL
jgi:hypothetical protein